MNLMPYIYNDHIYNQIYSNTQHPSCFDDMLGCTCRFLIQQADHDFCNDFQISAFIENIE
ncbi:hypothetical protein JHK82_046146 [Glycine max]|nr:hypothetical protein JHK82_046146 [Glycine max]KAG5107682.1 hypothetical protein JHK84_044589 [Glycine max]